MLPNRCMCSCNCMHLARAQHHVTIKVMNSSDGNIDKSCCMCRPVPREVTPPEVRAAREREKELAELDRDIRTVFAYNLNLKAEEKDLFQFFSTAGKVLDVRIISDRNTRRSKGFAYIEYARRVSFSRHAPKYTCKLCCQQVVQVELT